MQNIHDVASERNSFTHFKEAVDFLENTSQHVFITGKAGTGKSTLLQYFRDSTSKNVAVLAPTGVAALNVRGQTIHSFFRFKPDVTINTVDTMRLSSIRKKMYKKIEALIIDEVSMVRADLLDCIDAFLRLYGKDPFAPFGGVQMILFGDLFQLPPVVTAKDREALAGIYDSPYFFDAKVLQHISFSYMELEKIYRQKEEDFVKILNAIRENTAHQEDFNKLNQRCLPNFQPQQGDFYIYLTTTNEMADAVNQAQLERLKTKPYHFEGEITGEFEDRLLPTHFALDLKFQAQVMLLNNDPLGRWLNGSLGKVVSLIQDGEGQEMVEVELTNGERVEVKRFTWEMFRFFYNEKTQRLESESIGSFTQVPLKLAWAVTIHKSQGMTFPKVVLDIGRGTFSHGQIYVALSRCTTLNSLVLRKPISQRHILMDQRVVRFMQAHQKNMLKVCEVSN